ncbi:MAG: hypothetical protein A2505_09610 [Deltaproteobacteria bacterium RIFOXYD12_FULL_55_16]|nr:MAG: hypothetical protein A2505_09610 [Deltaproteobacteria bacterium RIFOXYD12_FULL_55_16]
MRDYAKKYSGTVVNRQQIQGKRSGGAEQEQPSRIIGAVMVVAMLLGAGSSLWFGVALQDGLGRLATGRQEKIELGTANVALLAEKEALLQQKRIEAAAGGLGLFPPSEKQLRKP